MALVRAVAVQLYGYQGKVGGTETVAQISQEGMYKFYYWPELDTLL